MILRPVRPASPIGPPTTNRPVGLTSSRTSEQSSAELRDLRADDLLADVRREHAVEVDVRGVLGGDHDGVQPHGLVAVVLDRHLRLAVRPQVGQHAPLARLGQPPGQAVGQRDRQRQQLRGVGVRVAEHQALVARALAVDLVVRRLDPALVGGVDALGDVGRLRADRHVHPARRAVEALGRRVVADLQDPVAHQPGDVDVAARGDLTRDVHLAGGHHGLDRHPAAPVLLEQRVEDAVADRVTHLVRMTLGHRLAREQPSTCVRHAVLRPHLRSSALRSR